MAGISGVSPRYDGGILYARGVCGLCNGGFLVAINAGVNSSLQQSSGGLAQACVDKNACPNCVKKLHDTLGCKYRSVRGWWLERHCAQLGCGKTFRVGGVPLSGYLRQSSSRAYNCNECVQRAAGTTTAAACEGGSEPVLQTPDAAQEGGLVGTHPHYKWIFEPVYARKRAGAHVPRPPVGELPDVICLDGAGDDPAAALAAAEIALLDNNYHTADALSASTSGPLVVCWAARLWTLLLLLRACGALRACC